MFDDGYSISMSSANDTTFGALLQKDRSFDSVYLVGDIDDYAPNAISAFTIGSIEFTDFAFSILDD